MLMEPVEMASIGCNRALLAEAHDGALAELFFDLTDSVVDGAGAFLQVVERHANSLTGLTTSPYTAGLHCGIARHCVMGPGTGRPVIDHE